MANEPLLRTLQETRQELVAERGERLGAVEGCRERLEDAEENLARARNQESAAVFADEDLKAKMNALRDHLNGLTEKPQALHEKLNRMGAEQVQTHRGRREASEIVRNRQSEIAEARTQLGIAEAYLKTAEKNLAEIDRQISSISN